MVAIKASVSWWRSKVFRLTSRIDNLFFITEAAFESEREDAGLDGLPRGRPKGRRQTGLATRWVVPESPVANGLSPHPR